MGLALLVGLYQVILDESHLKDLILQHCWPPTAKASFEPTHYIVLLLHRITCHLLSFRRVPRLHLSRWVSHTVGMATSVALWLPSRAGHTVRCWSASLAGPGSLCPNGVNWKALPSLSKSIKCVTHPAVNGPTYRMPKWDGWLPVFCTHVCTYVAYKFDSFASGMDGWMCTC